VELPRLASTAITVTDGGAPAAWAIVAWRRQPEGCNAWPGEASEYARRADASGFAPMSKLDPGRYSFVVSYGDRTLRRDVDLTPGVTPLVFEMR
jgi:hypothetical protein